ncbi:MAG: DUF2007 domain-containing protein [Deltaproteobacteria bacterium]|nr:DUF2007 domain-containing protein [Deltaproteobacteria bacterium]
MSQSSSSLPVFGASLRELEKMNSGQAEAEDLCVLTLCTSVVEADLYESQLRVEGIACRVDKDATSLYPSLSVGGIQIWVRREDLEEARAFIAEQQVEEELIGDQWKNARQQSDDDTDLFLASEEAQALEQIKRKQIVNRALACSIGACFLAPIGLPLTIYSLWILLSYVKIGHRSDEECALKLKAMLALGINAMWLGSAFVLLLTIL